MLHPAQLSLTRLWRSPGAPRKQNGPSGEGRKPDTRGHPGGAESAEGTGLTSPDAALAPKAPTHDRHSAHLGVNAYPVDVNKII
jgi:hypothetical protein